MRRIIVVVLSIVFALVVAAPVAAGQKATGSELTKAELTQKWWDWALQDPSPSDGSYKGGEECDGTFVDGAFFLAGQAFKGEDTPAKVKRTCTAPANTPILIPVINIICSEAYPEDPQPYDECATGFTDQIVDPPSTTYAKVDKKDVDQERIASGLFSWTIESDNNPFGLPAGTYESGSDGLWVYLEDGLKRGKHTVKVGGTYEDTPFGDFEGTRVTYKLKVR